MRTLMIVFVAVFLAAVPGFCQWPAWADGPASGGHWPPTNSVYTGLPEELLLQVNDDVASQSVSGGRVIYSIDAGVLAYRELLGAQAVLQTPLQKIVCVRPIPSKLSLGERPTGLLLLGRDSSGKSCAYVSNVSASGNPVFSWTLVYSSLHGGPELTGGDVVGENAYLIDAKNEELIRVGDGDGDGSPDFGGVVTTASLRVDGELPIVRAFIASMLPGGNKIVYDRSESLPYSTPQIQIIEPVGGGVSLVMANSELPSFVPELPSAVGGPLVEGQGAVALRYGEAAARVWLEDSGGNRISAFGGVSEDNPVVTVSINRSLLAGSTVRVRCSAIADFTEEVIKPFSFHLFAVSQVETAPGEAFVLPGANLLKRFVYEYALGADFNDEPGRYLPLASTYMGSDQVLIIAPVIGSAATGAIVNVRATDPVTQESASAWVFVSDPVEIPE